MERDVLKNGKPIVEVMARNVAEIGSANRSAAMWGALVSETDMLVLSYVSLVFKVAKETGTTMEWFREHVRDRQRRTYGEWEHLAAAEFERWLETKPSESPVLLPVLWRWESGLGNWVTNKLVGVDTVAPVMALQNARRLQLLGLGAPEAVRLPPYRLLRETIRRFVPGLVEIPFNEPLNAS